MASKRVGRLQRYAQFFLVSVIYCWLIVCVLTALHLSISYEPHSNAYLPQNLSQSLLRHKRGFLNRSLSLSQSALEHRSGGGGGNEAALRKWLNIIVEGTEIFLFHWKHVLMAVLLWYIIGKISDIVNLQIPLMLQSLFARISSIMTAKDDSEPPPLEDMTYQTAAFSSSSSGVLHMKEAWMVYDPIFGVIPQETKRLWDDQQVERSEAYEKMVAAHQRRRLPPVRGME